MAYQLDKKGEDQRYGDCTGKSFSRRPQRQAVSQARQDIP